MPPKKGKQDAKAREKVKNTVHCPVILVAVCVGAYYVWSAWASLVYHQCELCPRLRLAAAF